MKSTGSDQLESRSHAGQSCSPPGLPKDSLSLPRDMSFAPDGRLLQRFVPELARLRIESAFIPHFVTHTRKMNLYILFLDFWNSDLIYLCPCISGNWI